jgi:phospholipase D3/4
MQSLFNRWWQWTATDGTPTKLMTALDSSIQQARKVPCWEQEPAAFEENPDACPNPFSEEDTTSFNFQHPMSLQLNGSQSQSFVSCSPPAVCDAALASNAMYGRAPEGREWDGNALIRTILSAKESVDLSVMDFVPSSIYMKNFPPSYWAGLNDALIAKVRQGARVRMLISKWGSSKEEMWRYLNALKALADACLDDYNPCKGSLEIRQFALPGWDKTKDSHAEFPPFSRVNHAKYIVTDNRFNIGTSNMAWSYFYNTAGASFNSDHPELRLQLQSAFNRDWASSYASALEPTAAQLI